MQSKHPTHPKRNEKALFLLAGLFVTMLLFLSLFVGAYDIFNQPDGAFIFWTTRFPRTVALLLSGAAMSICGLVMQLISQNRFVEPSTTGTVEWAGLGLLLVYALIPSPTLVQRMTGAIVFAFIGTLFFFFLLQRVRLKSSLLVPTIGIMLGAVVSAFSTFLSLIAQLSQTLEVWFQGSFSSVERGRYEYLWWVVLITVLVYRYSDRLTVAGLGKEVSTNLGINYRRMVLIGNVLVSAAVGIVSAVIGKLPFLGLIVPNLISLARGDDVKSNLPWVALLGMGSILLADIGARVLIAPFELPVSLILGTVGAFFFLALLIWQRSRR